MFAVVLILLCAASSVSASAKSAAAGPRLHNNQLYKFSYTTEVLLDKAKGSKEGGAGYKISSEVNINLVWRDPSSKDDQLIQLAISNVKIEHVSPRSEKKNILQGSTVESVLGKGKLTDLTKPFLVHLKNGKTKAFYSYWTEPAVIKNLKRGLASLLQFQLLTGKVVENDISGRCTVQYQAAKDQITRTKILDTCKTSESGFTTHSKVLGVGRKSSSVTVFTLEDGFIRSAVAEETHSLAINARRSTAVKVVSRQILVKTAKEAGPLEVAGKDVAGVVKSIDGKLAALFEHWQAEQKQLEPASLSKASAPRSFLALIQSIRKASKDEILKVLKSASKTSLPQVVDAVTSSQTPESLDAMIEFLNFTDAKGLVLQERFLYACGFASHPNERMLQALLDISKGKIGSIEIKESVVIIMGALVHKLCLKGGCNLPTVVQNSLLPEAVPIFTKYAESEVGSYNTIALTALQRYDVSLMTSEVKRTVNRIYHQTHRIYEKNVRVAAADVILSSNPSYMEVKNLLLSIGNLPHEMNKYMLSKIQDNLRFQLPASKVIREALKHGFP
ncbi:hypothetical protein OJAV_G00006380 [Oryzias javanicus]|uniref:Vitellogenin domain-containing protein n=1 Tax=Oryzias javanicus TaxID=123683 RepID=A0A3S2N917_ORYJA|nr:hypothetical protein OJAV_G00006380 [Oryzias javanicus]